MFLFQHKHPKYMTDDITTHVTNKSESFTKRYPNVSGGTKHHEYFQNCLLLKFCDQNHRLYFWLNRIPWPPTMYAKNWSVNLTLIDAYRVRETTHNFTFGLTYALVCAGIATFTAEVWKINVCHRTNQAGNIGFVRHLKLLYVVTDLKTNICSLLPPMPELLSNL